MCPRPLAPAALALAGALACQAAGAGTSPGAEPATLSPQTAEAIAAMTPALNSAGEGRRLFLKLNCYSCHGIFAGGAIGPSIVGVSLSQVEDDVINGNESGMPSFAAYVDQTDLVNLAHYLESIGTKKEPKFMDWWKKNPKK